MLSSHTRGFTYPSVSPPAQHPEPFADFAAGALAYGYAPPLPQPYAVAHTGDGLSAQAAAVAAAAAAAMVDPISTSSVPGHGGGDGVSLSSLKGEAAEEAEDETEGEETGEDDTDMEDGEVGYAGEVDEEENEETQLEGSEASVEGEVVGAENAEIDIGAEPGGSKADADADTLSETKNGASLIGEGGVAAGGTGADNPSCANRDANLGTPENASVAEAGGERARVVLVPANKMRGRDANMSPPVEVCTSAPHDKSQGMQEGLCLGAQGDGDAGAAEEMPVRIDIVAPGSATCSDGEMSLRGAEQPGNGKHSDEMTGPCKLNRTGSDSSANVECKETSLGGTADDSSVAPPCTEEGLEEGEMSSPDTLLQVGGAFDDPDEEREEDDDKLSSRAHRNLATLGRGPPPQANGEATANPAPGGIGVLKNAGDTVASLAGLGIGAEENPTGVTVLINEARGPLSADVEITTGANVGALKKPLHRRVLGRCA